MRKTCMIRKFIEIIIICAVIFVSYPFTCYAKAYSAVEGKIIKGQSKQAITELLGEPVEKKVIVKRNKYIWGPQEEFWDEIPMETQLEVWKYEFSDGYLNLYFINEGNHLNYKAFAPKGVIY
ncbi:MAG: hypothetical protein Q8M34_07620 [Thermodesulfovibrionales bacterium]|nr:hypothetical protein [Thermodesulfovibrionales bacterium]